MMQQMKRVVLKTLDSEMKMFLTFLYKLHAQLAYIYLRYLSVNTNLGGGGGVGWMWGCNFTCCWFSLNNSEMVKAVTLAFCRIQ